MQEEKRLTGKDESGNTVVVIKRTNIVETTSSRYEGTVEYLTGDGDHLNQVGEKMFERVVGSGKVSIE